MGITSPDLMTQMMPGQGAGDPAGGPRMAVSHRSLRSIKPSWIPMDPRFEAAVHEGGEQDYPN